MDAATHIALSLVVLLVARPAPPLRRPHPAVAASAAYAGPRIPEAAHPDRWFGDDKFRHLTMSFATTSFAFAAARSLGMDDGAAPAAAAATLAAGIGKELFDARSGGFFSLRDLAWDVAGAVAGYAVARNVR